MGLTTLFVLLGGGLMALAMFFKTGLVGVAFANLVTTMLTGALFLKIVKSYVKWFGIARPVFAAVRKFLGLSWWFLAWTLVLQLFKAGDVVILGIFDSAELVTHYSLTRYIPETIIGVVAIIVFGITPGLGGVVGKGDFEKAVRVRGELMIFTWLIVTVFGSTMLLWNHSFVQLWVGNEYYAGTISNLLIILMVSQFVFIRNDANIIDVTLNLKSKALLGMISAGCSAALAGVMVGIFKLGIVGITLGFIGGQLILSIGYPMIVGRFFKIPISSQFKGVLRPAIITIFLFVSHALMGNFLTMKTWLSLVLAVSLTVGLLSGVTFYFGVNAEQRKKLLGRIRKILPGNGL
jgi:O-antigen/teichoic acid export membrane protein